VLPVANEDAAGSLGDMFSKAGIAAE